MIDEAIDRIINSDEIGVDDLLADAMAVKDGISDLLAEVKRLREENERLRDMIEKAVGYGAYDEEYRGEEE